VLITPRIRRTGRLAALAAAYALVLNVMMAGVLQAAVSPLKAAAGHELCLGSASASAETDGADNAGSPLVHCPLCISSTAVADLAPPAPALTIRIALRVLIEPAAADHLAPRLSANDHRPRGPPHLG
jgi:hypothetical protein